METESLHTDKLSAIQKGDDKAFKALFVEYYPTLCAYANRFVILEDAEEIVQDSLLWIWENRETLIIESSLNSYLFKMVYNRSINRLIQTSAIQQAHMHYYEDMQEILQNTEPYLIEELNARIKEAIQSLPESYREAFVMNRFHNMSCKEIAEKLNVSPKTVYYRIQKSLELLRNELKDYLPLLLAITLHFK